MRRKGILSFFVILIMAGMLFATPVSAQNQPPASDMKFGLGYQGTWIQGLLNGVSARIWMQDDLGMEGNLYMGNVDGNYSLYIIEGKFMYAPIVREQSRFYFGGILNLSMYDFAPPIDDARGVDASADGIIVGLGPVFGAEWRYEELPEIGFNFDVGLKYYHDGGDIDMNVWATDVTWGIHYYF